MADKSGQAEIRGIDIDKQLKADTEEAYIFKNYAINVPTSAREIRWYQQTAGVLDATSPSTIANVAPGARPDVLETSVTRNTSYVRKYFVESPMISQEDIKDSDVDILLTNIKQLARAIAAKVDTRIYDVLSDATGIETTAAVADGWDDSTTGKPITDLAIGARKIRANGFDISNLTVFMNPIEYQNLLIYLIDTKGSSVPALASDLARGGVLMQIIGQKIVVSNNATTDEVIQFIPNLSVKWKSFIPPTARSIEEPGIGTKIRAWEEGEAICEFPKSVHKITDTVV